MKRFITLALIGLATVLVAAPAARAAGNASVYVVHGIPGQDLGLDPALPVDVSVGGSCAIPGFEFGEIVGPVPLPAGTYAVAVSLANPDAPCSNPPVIGPVDVPFAAGENASVVAHLSATGAPTASKFVNDLSRIRLGRARALVHHVAKAPAVDVTLKRAGFFFPVRLTLADLTNPEQAGGQLLAGLWRVSIAPAGEKTPVFGPVRAFFKPFSTYLIYAVGSLDTGSFTLLQKEIRTH
jgi:hypothetical protein